MRKFSFVGVLMLPLFIAACSPHPGAGDWQANPSAESDIGRIQVNYEGRAEIFVSGQEMPLWRCFWGGKDRNSIAMQCAYALDSDREETFVLETLDREHARLYQEGQFVTTLTRQLKP